MTQTEHKIVCSHAPANNPTYDNRLKLSVHEFDSVSNNWTELKSVEQIADFASGIQVNSSSFSSLYNIIVEIEDYYSKHSTSVTFDGLTILLKLF